MNRTRTIGALLALLSLILIDLIGVHAIDIPLSGSAAFVQTTGSQANLGIADWYTHDTQGDQPHRFEIHVACTWPSTTPITFALYDPEVALPNPSDPTAIDEVRNASNNNSTNNADADDAHFRLTAPGGAVVTRTFTPTGGTNQQWYELVTVTPATTGYGCGTYTLETRTGEDFNAANGRPALQFDNDDNAWRLRIGNDPDCVAASYPQMGVCSSTHLGNANYTDDLDGNPGTGDELVAALTVTSYQHASQSCQDFFYYVDGNVTPIRLNNFDMDSAGTASVTHYPVAGSNYAPSQTGTVSGGTVWNGTGATASTRVGDEFAIDADDIGWWKSTICINSGNQYIFEYQKGPEWGKDLFFEQPPTPVMTLTKSDGRSRVNLGESTTYTLTFTNTSVITSTAGFADNVVLTDTLPVSLTYRSCGINAPFSGSCSYDPAAHVVSYSLDQIVEWDQSGSVTMTAIPNQTGTIVNQATIRYDDPVGNTYPTVTAFDTSIAQVPGSIGDLVWYDADGDGVQDAGEPGLANVDLTITWAGPDNVLGSGGDDVVYTVTTDSRGRYRVGGLPDGNFEVDVDGTTLPAWLTLSAGTDPLTFALASGEQKRDADFGYTNGSLTKGVVGDYLWSDADGDGVQDPGEPGIGGVTLALIDESGSVVATTTTDASGHYYFSGVDPALYRVDVTDSGGVLAGYTLTTGPQSQTDPSAPIQVVAGGSYLEGDFGYRNPALFSIGDRLWYDADGDGTQDAGETGIEGVTVTLLDASGTVIATAITNVEGNFSFDGVPAGSYTVAIADGGGALSGYEGTTPAAVADRLAVTVGPGSHSGVSFGYNRPGSIGDTIFSDADGDGAQDPGEPGIGGVSALLWRDTNLDGIFDSTVDTQVGSTTTAADGSYRFDALDAARYFVSVDDAQAPLVGYTATTTDDETGPNAAGTQIEVLLAAGESNLDADFGYRNTGLATIGGALWDDLDEDAADDGAGEPPLAAVTVDLLDASGNVIATTTTNASGSYRFFDLPTGSYTVDVTDTAGVLQGYHLTTPTEPTAVALAATDILTVNFGYTRDPETATLGDLVWQDVDGDGVRDGGEPGLAGVTITLDLGGGSVLTTTTGLTGSYSFSALPAGVYTVTVDSATLPASSRTPTHDLDGVASAFSTVVWLAAGADRGDVDFGFTTADGAIGNSIWIDEDSDGVQDAGEPGLSNVTVELYAASDTPGVDAPLASGVSDARGGYLFTDLPPGDYQIYVPPAALPAGLSQSTTTPGAGDGNNQSSPHAVTLGPDEEYLAADFGYNWAPSANVTGNSGTGAIGDRLWVDSDGDGVQDGGELGLSGVTVELLGPGTDGIFGTVDDAVVMTDTTDASGSYIFTGLAAGGYRVRVNGGNAPAGYTQSGDPDATLDNRSEIIALAPGDVYLSADFGYTPTGSPNSIGDRVFVDLDGDGLFDAGETGIEGVSVVLARDGNGNDVIDAGEVVATTLTDATGGYLFTGVPDGDYLIAVTDSDNILGTLVPTDDGDQDGGLTPHISAQTVAGGLTYDQHDFGYAPPDHAPGDGLIGDTIYFDEDGDGTRDPDEDGIEGAILTLTDGTTSWSATTDEVGHYAFGDLPAGTYTLTLATPVGLAVSSDPAGGSASQSVVTLTAGQVNLAQDWGLNAAGATGQIGNQIFEDLDADGVMDGGEGGIAGVTVDLYRDTNGNEILDSGDTRLGTTVSAPDGTYSFDRLPYGDYLIDVSDRARILAGWWHSVGTTATDNHSQADPFAVTLSVTTSIEAAADFGYYHTPGALGNRVWNDTDGDGLQDPGEGGISGITVTLTITYSGGVVVPLSTVTDASGYYAFPNLLLDEAHNGDGAGAEPTYSIGAGVPAGYTVAPLGQGNGRNDSDDPAGVAVQPVQGQADLTAQADPSLESSAAGIDFGLISGLDFGDLPASYGMTTLAQNGARHLVGALYLGRRVDVEADGQPDATATGDDLVGVADDDGVARTPGVTWTNGTDGGSLDMVASGDGFAAVWVDWNDDGAFGASERVLVDQTVGSTPQSYSFDIPIGVDPNGSYFMRVRLYDASTTGDALPTGYGGAGEVEDYTTTGVPTAITLESFDARSEGDRIRVTWVTASEIDNLGFNLYRGTTPDAPGGQPLNATLIPSQAPGAGMGFAYEQMDVNVSVGESYYYWLEDVDIFGVRTLHGPVSVTHGVPTAVGLGSFGVDGGDGSISLLALGLALLCAALARRRVAD